MDDSAPSPVHPCLWCGEVLPEPLAQTTRCPHCGRGNRRDDLARYRTLNPRARNLQTALEVGSAVVLGVCFLAAVVNWRHLKGGDPRVHWAILGPAILALIVFYRSRFLTHRRPPSRFSVSPLSCGFILLSVATYFTFISLTLRDLEGGVLHAVLVVAAIVVALMGFRVLRAMRSTT